MVLAAEGAADFGERVLGETLLGETLLSLRADTVIIPPLMTFAGTDARTPAPASTP